METKEFLNKQGYSEKGQGEGYILTVAEMNDLLIGFETTKIIELKKEISRLNVKYYTEKPLFKPKK